MIDDPFDFENLNIVMLRCLDGNICAAAAGEGSVGGYSGAGWGGSAISC
ncbi:hypothetical protein VSR17_07720 [Cupriavidus taiwanensis]|nr:hypothetical protein [Cupriavidus taiwanensis]